LGRILSLFFVPEIFAPHTIPHNLNVSSGRQEVKMKAPHFLPGRFSQAPSRVPGVPLRMHGLRGNYRAYPNCFLHSSILIGVFIPILLMSISTSKSSPQS